MPKRTLLTVSCLIIALAGTLIMMNVLEVNENERARGVDEMKIDTNNTVGSSDPVSQREATKHQNQLILSKSPYLLQHADNPVAWYQWGEKAFEKARQEDKPIFLSIGYSTCHWCHVMAHETFEDEEAARLMNDTFVSIKVDREERPDIDHIYMTVCQMMTGGGGWPLTIIMTPDRRPFFAGTYIPKENRFGRIGMLELTRRIKDIWATRREEVVQSADKITEALRQVPDDVPGEAPGEGVLKSAYDQLALRYDSTHGGFSQAPKFPTPHNLFYLLRYWKRTGEQTALQMVEKTLQAMRLGGVYDHVGFGFHRYSTDEEWLVPHFEKMLYDQAMLALAYLEAYQATGKDAYGKTAEEIFTYVLRDMTAAEGGFYSAEDADSEGEEGKFYVWKLEEIRQVLGDQDARLASQVFNVELGGNFKEEATGRVTGTNILHMRKPVPKMAEDLEISEQELRERLEVIRQKLFQYRKKRVHPHTDDKILTDWNGIMIAALSRGAQVLGRSEYQEAAKRAALFVLNTMRAPDGRLLHRYRDGQAAITACVDDYAFFTWGLLDLYEATFEVRFLKSALELNGDFLKYFWDDKIGGFFFTASDAQDLLVRKKEIYDGATPSGNSVAALNLLRLARITANPEFEERAESIGRAFAGNIKQMPSAFTQFLSALEFAIGPSYEVVIAGDPDSDDTSSMLEELRKPFIPNKVVIFRPIGEQAPPIVDIAPYTRQQEGLADKATAYVCMNFNCELPATDTAKMLELLGAKKP